MWVLLDDNKNELEKFGKPRGFTLNDIQYPKEVFTLWTVAEKKALGIYSVDPSTQPYNPNTQAITKTVFKYYVAKDQVREFYTLETYSAEYLANREKRRLFGEAEAALVTANNSMPRATEDLIDTLVTNGILLLAQLPQETQDTHALKKAMRSQRNSNAPEEK